MGVTPDIQLLFGVKGGGSVGGASGKLIKDQLTGIIANINKEPMGVKVKLDSTTERSLTDAMSKALSNIEKKDLDIKVGKINADSAIAKFRKDLEAVVKSVSLQSGYSILLDKADVATIVAEYNGAADAAGKAADQAERVSQATSNAAKNAKKLSAEADTAIKTTNKTFNRATTTISKLGVSEEDVARAQALSQACVEVKKKMDQVREAGSSADDKLLTELEEARATLAKLTDETNEYLKTTHKVGKQGASSLSQISAVTLSLAAQFDGLRQKLGSFLSLHTLVTKLYSAAKNMVSVVTEIDTAMTELKKVTNETDAAYRQFLENAAVRAKALGATISDTVSATADAARLGFDIDDASDLADAFLVYKNVGDGLNNIEDASASIISTMQAFRIEASDAMTIVDKFNNVGNNFAISSAGIGDALLRSASAMKAANNTLDETIALTTAANAVVQDPLKVGGFAPNGTVMCRRKIAISVKGQRWFRPRKDFILYKKIANSQPWRSFPNLFSLNSNAMLISRASS